MLWDSWHMCQDMSNRIVCYEGEKYHVWELLDLLRSEGRLSDVFVDGELYNACQVEVFVPKIGNACFLVNVKGGY
jgi:hypothetical protein